MTSITPSKYVQDTIWSSRINVLKQVTIPSMLRQLKETGRWDCLDLKYREGNGVVKPHYFWDSDVAKFIESLCYGLKYCNLEEHKFYTQLIEEIIIKLQKAQQSDGYINSYFTTVEPSMKFKNIAWKHELYCAGHLLECAVAHFETTGSERMLDIICKYIDLICVVFGPGEGQLHGYPGHQVLEMALVKLYKIRPLQRYFDLLEYFIEQRGYNSGEFFDEEAWERGVNPFQFVASIDTADEDDDDFDTAWPEPRSYWYMQADSPIRDLKEVKGHSVRVVYYLTGVQGLANITKDKTLFNAVWRLWTNMTERKMYIHGGIGSQSRWEGFGTDFELPWKGYSETCASVGIMFLGRALLEWELNGAVAEVMERALYNDVLGGISIDGKAFYYDQPIVGSKLKRQEWFTCSCCPPNVTRLFNNLEEYIYTLKPHLISINLFIGSYYSHEDIEIKLETSYPYEGKIMIKIKSKRPIMLAIKKPSVDSFKSSHSNYKTFKDYIFFNANVWQDTIFIEFNIPIEIITPDPRVAANVGKLAVKRGPFIYAVEQNGFVGDLSGIAIARDTKFAQVEEMYDNLKYISLITLVESKVVKFVPYFVTGNQTPGEDFRVWVNDVSQ